MNQLWLIPVLPLAGFLLNGLVALVASSSRAEKESGADHPLAPLPYAQRLFHGVVGVGSVGLAAVLSFAALVPYVLASRSAPEGLAPVVQKVYTWMVAGEYSVDVAFRLDALSALMLSFVTFVGTLIHVYSVGYMQKDEGYGRYFSYLNLFMFAMLMLVLADNLPLLFVGWEGVGLCSYLLIGYSYEKEFAAAAGKKAFIVNRVGDLGMVLGIFGVFALFGTADYSFVDLARRQVLAGGAPLGVYAVCLLLFLGACGKSAQVPLYVWLPDAMAGPTPVSALIHAATMVTAGVYLVARCSALFVLAPDALTLVAWIGAGTAIFAATIGLAQNDIKKVLAYSTVSQLGYMFLACGMGAFSAGIFHVFTHSFFKACLFLGSGSVIMSMHHEQDLRQMGGLSARIPHTFRTMLVATLAIAGIFPLAGFFSKDAILGSAAASGHWALYAVGLFTAGLTAFYMFRLVSMAFFGKARGHAVEAHESPATMTVPLWILAALSVVAGFLGVPAALGGSDRIGRFLEASVAHPEIHEMSHGLEIGLMLLSLGVAVTGLAWAWRWYGKADGPAEAVSPQAHAFYEKTGALGRLVANKWNVDEGIEALVLSPFRKIGTFLWRGFDVLVIDGIANASAFLVELSGDLLRFFTTGHVRNYALAFTLGVAVFLVYVWVR
ncbi:MAG TPA: NADH-quinone oxidoreductase subunit L [Thermoanaerobaculia bacterium]|nr:NADH-quinone oxidoreductase subunit L [Thermoanaerobaculia bacterium]